MNGTSPAPPDLVPGGGIGRESRFAELLAAPATPDPQRPALLVRRIEGRSFLDLIPNPAWLSDALRTEATAQPSAAARFVFNAAAESLLRSAPRELVVVVVSTYNSSRYVLATLATVAAQDHSPLLVVVADDGSTDDTARKVEEFAAGSGTALALAVIPHLGNPGLTRNVGLYCLCPPEVEYVTFMDGDDLYASPDAVRRLVEAVRPDPRRIAAFGDYDWIDQNGDPLARAGGIRATGAGAEWRARRRLTWTNLAVGNLVVFHLQCLLVRAGAPFMPYRPHGEDAEYYCLLFRWSAALWDGGLDGVVQLPALIARYRKHDASLTARPLTTAWQEPPRTRRYPLATELVPRFYDLAAIPDEYVTADNVSQFRSRQFAREFLRAAFRAELGRAWAAVRVALRTPGMMARHVLALPAVELATDPSTRDVLRRTLLVVLRGRRRGGASAPPSAS